MSEEKYFTFPLSVLHGLADPSTSLDCIDLALNCGMMNAGVGLYRNDREKFEEILEEAIEKHDIRWKISAGSYRSTVLVGAKICGVKLGATSQSNIDIMIDSVNRVQKGGALVRMAGKYFWPAFYQARAECNTENEWPERGISWREFRILCAILSVKRNSNDFSFIGWETIQLRACGFTNKAEFKTAAKIPDHLAPPLSRKKIRATCDALEDLGFFARFRFSKGKTGGYMAYSFRHSRDELAKVVCDAANFRDRAKIKANRAEDARKCLKLLERAKVGPTLGQGEGQGRGQGRGQHKDKYSE
jgi:hypothetical protein